MLLQCKILKIFDLGNDGDHYASLLRSSAASASLSSTLPNDVDSFLDSVLGANSLHNRNLVSASQNFFAQPSNSLFSNQQISETFRQSQRDNLDILLDSEDESMKKLINERIAKIDRERYQVIF